MISFVISYDKKHRLSTHWNAIIQSLQRRIDKEDLIYLRYQLQILSDLLTMKSSMDIPQEFYDTIRKKLSLDTDHDSWIDCMKQFVTLMFIKEPPQISANDFLMKFLRSLAEQINWSMENGNHLSKLSDQSWRKIFTRLLASMNALLTHRMKKYECIHLSTMKRSPKGKVHLLREDDDEENDVEQENHHVPTVSRKLFHDNGEEEEENHDDDDEIIQQDVNLLPQHSDLDQLEQELLHTNPIFSSVERWLELVRTILVLQLVNFFV